MTKDEALQMCLEYIETNAHERRHVRWAIKEALAQPPLPVQQPMSLEIKLPVGFMNAGVSVNNFFTADTNDSKNWDTIKFPLPKGNWAIKNVKENVVTLVNEAPLPVQEPAAWRELVRRLYVELFHVNQQLTSILNDDHEPMYSTGSTVRDAMNDAQAALDAAPLPVQPTEEWPGQSNIESLYNACQHREYCKQLKAQPPLLENPDRSVAGYCKKIEELIAERDRHLKALAQPAPLPVQPEQEHINYSEWNYNPMTGEKK